MRYLLFFTGLFLYFQTASSQDRINGKIIDSRSGDPLPFANIIYNSRGSGIVSNIDGKFSIAVKPDVEFLKFSYLGYHSFYKELDSNLTIQELTIKLVPKYYDLNEVSVVPGINPAHRIINLTIENRDLNNPEKMKSFSYRSYNKMYFTVLYDTLTEYPDVNAPETSPLEGSYPETGQPETGSPEVNPLQAGDSVVTKTKNFVKNQHLFLMEFVSEREFLYPDKNKEIVTASRVSGFKDPSFILLASQIQSFTFYDDLIMISDKKYLNPVSRGSMGKYLFILEDTLFTDRNDTLFIISYRPLRGKNFDGLKGILHINSNGYAIQEVIAEAAGQEDKIKIRIRQKYDWIENQQWFPVELNTDIIIVTDKMKANGVPGSLAGIGKSYLSDIVLNPELKNRNFSPVETRVEDDAHMKSDDYWVRYRVVPLSSKDTNTYRIIDSIGEAAHLDRSLDILEILTSGYIPWKFLDINYRSIVNYNIYEGFRFGLGVQTNRKLSEWFTIGGHLNWGTCDKDFKYGGHLKVFIDPVSETFIQYRFNNDVMESAGIRFLDDIPQTSSENFRKYLIRDMDIVEEHEVQIGSSLIRYLRFNVFLNHSVKQVTTGYRFLADSESPSSGLFRFTELGLGLRFALKEKFMETPRGNRISVGTNWPILNLNVIKGMEQIQGEYDYLKLEAKISKTFITKSFGNTLVTLSGGLADSNIPYPNLYNGYGSYGAFVPEVENSFATMRMNEFIMDRFAFAFVQQDFGSLFFKRGNFRPSIVLVTHAGYGKLLHVSGHENIELKTIEKGYYESGILFKNMLRQWFIGYGLGAFYRYGPYSLHKTFDNFAFKFTISINI